jgi:hypothetical protein
MAGEPKELSREQRARLATLVEQDHNEHQEENAAFWY